MIDVHGWFDAITWWGIFGTIVATAWIVTICFSGDSFKFQLLATAIMGTFYLLALFTRNNTDYFDGGPCTPQAAILAIGLFVSGASSIAAFATSFDYRRERKKNA